MNPLGERGRKPILLPVVIAVAVAVAGFHAGSVSSVWDGAVTLLLAFAGSLAMLSVLYGLYHRWEKKNNN